MMDRGIQRELIKALLQLNEMLRGIDFSDGVQRQTVVEILEAVNKRCKMDFTAPKAAAYAESLSGLAQIIGQTNWLNLQAEEKHECRNLCQEIIQIVIGKLRQESEIKKDIVFLPYKASMWDSLESVWREASEDREHCNTYVIPIPYADRNEDGTVAAWHCEADMFPDDVPVLDWHDYTLEKLKAWQPDAIFIHNPYDDHNAVTSVDGQYYSSKLKTATAHLYYIPYYSTSGGMSENQKSCPAYENVEAIFVQAECLRGFFDESVRDKVQPLGSPKFDKVIHLCQNPPEPPAGWREKMKGRKVYFYNTSLQGMLADVDAFVQKMMYVFKTFEGRQDACILWRPHPLMMATLKSIRSEAVAKYEAARDYFITHDIGIYDDTPMIETAIAWSDVYIGDSGTSVTSLFGVAGKPIFVLDNQIHELPGPDDWLGKAFNGVQSMDEDWIITWNNCLFHSPNHDHHYEFYCRLAEDQDGAYYQFVHPVGDKLYICPAGIPEVLVIRNKKIIKRIKLREDESRDGLFARSVLLQNKIFMIPLRYSAIVCLDLRDDSVSYIEGTKDVVSILLGDFWFVGGSCVWQDKLVVSAASSAKQFIITPETLAVETIDLEPDRISGFSGLVPEDDKIWLLPIQGQEIWCWDPRKGNVKKYVGFPDGFTCEHPGMHFECDLMPLGSVAFANNTVYITPNWGNKFLKLDRASGKISEWKNDFKPSPQAANGYLYTWAIGWFFWQGWDQITTRLPKFMYAPTRTLYQVDWQREQWEKVPVSFDDDSKERMAIGFDRMSKWFLYGCIENAFNSLKDLLDGNIHGKAFDKERQLKAYESIAVNNDGTAGEKIYAYTRKQLGI